MSLIKCIECGKEVSDKATVCIHCGCPIGEKLTCNECGEVISKNDEVCKNCGCPIKVIKEKENKNTNINTTTKTWLIICVITCFLISGINYFNLLSILNLASSNFVITIGSININVMGTLALLLGGSYITLLKNLSKKNFIILLAINGLILLYNLASAMLVINFFYILCVIANVLITFFIVKKDLNNSEFNLKDYIPLLIIFVAILVLPSPFISLKGDSVLGTYMQDGGAETTLILLEDNVCSMSVANQDSKYPATISRCHWSINDDRVTINFTMSMSNAYGQVYTRDNTFTGTYNGDSITMDKGAVYYKR